MDQPSGISQYIVDQAAQAPQQFYPPPPTATIYVAHPRAAPKQGVSLMTALLIVLLVVAIAYLVYYMYQGRHRRSLVRDLVASGWILYTRPGCGFCTKQMQALGVDAYPKQVVCAGAHPADSHAPVSCKEIGAFPTWLNTKTHEVSRGYKSRAQLKQMLR